MAENWIKIKESLYKGAFLRNEKRGSSSESSSNRDWAEGELFRQEPLSIEIRNGTLETGNSTEVGEDGRLEMEKWKMDIELEWFLMGNWPEPKHNECELTESDSAFCQLSAELENTLFTLSFFLFLWCLFLWCLYKNCLLAIHLSVDFAQMADKYSAECSILSRGLDEGQYWNTKILKW